MKTYATFSEAWQWELHETRSRGLESSPRGMTTFERRWPQFAVADPMSFPVKNTGRHFANVIGVLEALSIVGQFSVTELFTHRIARFHDFTDGGVFHGSYGARLFGELQDLVDLLKSDHDTRQAVLTIYDSTRDLNRRKRDIPCTISLQFLDGEDGLEMRVTMRSNDLWLGTPYDFTQFAIVQASVAQAIGSKPGLYVHTAGSLHIYERDTAKSLKCEAAVVHDPFPFPLWASQDNSLAAISERARGLAFGSITPVTEFEKWAFGLLHTTKEEV